MYVNKYHTLILWGMNTLNFLLLQKIECIEVLPGDDVKDLENIVYHPLLGNWMAGFRGFQLMQINEPQRLFSRDVLLPFIISRPNKSKQDGSNVTQGCTGYFFK